MATLYQVEGLEAYVQRREVMRRSIGWKVRGKMRSRLKVWEWEMGVGVEEEGEPDADGHGEKEA